MGKLKVSRYSHENINHITVHVQECLTDVIIICWSSYHELFFETSTLRIRSKSLKSVCERVRLLLKMQTVDLQFYQKQTFLLFFLKIFGKKRSPTFLKSTFFYNNYLYRKPIDYCSYLLLSPKLFSRKRLFDWSCLI